MFTLTFNTDNDAFADGNCDREIARICRDVAQRLGNGQSFGKVRDVNGNAVGEFAYHADDDDAPQATR
jgi:hypothetical protein